MPAPLLMTQGSWPSKRTASDREFGAHEANSNYLEDSTEIRARFPARQCTADPRDTAGDRPLFIGHISPDSLTTRHQTHVLRCVGQRLQEICQFASV